MSDFNYFLNRQGPRGMQGEKGEKGNDGNTPTFYAGVDSGTQYTLIIDMGDGNTFETSNLMPTFVNTGGTYLRYDTVNNRYVSAQADKADLSGNVGEVKLATTTSVANETVEDSDAVSYELFRQSGGGGGGTSFIPGTGLELTNADVLNVKIDNNTITTNSSGQLVASGGGTTYTAGDAIDLTGDAISVKTDGTSIGLNASNELELKATIPAAQIQSDWTQADNTKVDFIKNKPTIGAGVITFTQGATVLGTIDVNQTTATTINIPSSGGGGGGSTYAAGNGISISNADVISAKVDGTSIDFDASGNLKFVNGAGYITGITSGDVTTALGYTPYSSANPDGYTTNVGTVTSVNNTNPDSNGNVTISIPDTTNMVTTNTTQTISGTKTFSTETHFTGNLTFDSGLGTPIIRGMSGASYRNMITRSNTYTTVTAGNTSDNLILKGALTRPKYSHDSSDGGYLALYSDIPGDMTGAAAGTAGTHGLVPAPAAGDNEKFLRGDGTWQTVSGGSSTDVQINGVSITSNGVANIKTNNPITYQNSTTGVEKFNYTGTTGTTLYKTWTTGGVMSADPSGTFYFIGELTNGLNFITTFFGAPGSSTNIKYSFIRLGTYSGGTFTPLIGIAYQYGSPAGIEVYDLVNDSEIIKFYGGISYTSGDNTNNTTLLCFNCNSSTGETTVAFSGKNGINYNQWCDNYTIANASALSLLASCTHIQVGLANAYADSTADISGMVFTNPSTSYASQLTSGSSGGSSSDTELMTLADTDTNIYNEPYSSTSGLILNYDSATLDVDNGALKVKDNTFITEASLQTVHCVVETYQNGASYYRLYDDGWVEQMFYSSVAGTFNWLIPYSDTNYYVLAPYLTGVTSTSVTISTGCWCYSVGYAA